MPPKEDPTTKEMIFANIRLHGVLKSYVTGESFESYLHHLESFFRVNKSQNLDDEFKVNLVFNMIGTDPSEKITKALLPKNPSELSYDEFVKVMESIFTVEKKCHRRAFQI